MDPASFHFSLSVHPLNMKVSGAIFSVVLLQIVGCSQVHYEVPEPLFQVFSPKGLRVSLPDCVNIKSVEFYLNVPRVSETLTKEVQKPDGAFWVYWNPDVVVHPQEKIVYKLMVRNGDLYWKKEGVHVVDKVKGLANDTDCSENQGQKIISGLPIFVGTVEDTHKDMLSTGRTSSFKSAYSMQKNSNLKPITKSSTSTTSGTFYVKPSGVMEATGYKKESSYDSTKAAGEQWKHYEAELTAEELENMRRLYGPDFYGFPHLSGNLFPSSGKIYEKNYMSSESQKFPAELRYAESPATTHQFHSSYRTHESSSSNSKPLFQFHPTDSFRPPTSFQTSQKEERQYRVESVNNLPKPLPPHGTMFRATEYVREEHIPPVQTESSQTLSGRETHTGSLAPQKIVQVSQTGEISSHNQEIIKPSFNPVVSQASQLEYNSGNLQTVEGRGDLRSRHYVGNIFTSVKSTKAKIPQECTLIPGVDYTPSGNLREVEKFVFELSCLATVAESSMKEEIALLKQKNAGLSRKFELLEHEIKRLSAQCNCYE